MSVGVAYDPYACSAPVVDGTAIDSLDRRDD